MTWNCAAELDGLLRSLDEHLTAGFEVVVVDNASEDDVADVAARHDFVRFVETGENLGFGLGNNRGVAEASAPVSVLINPDTYLIDDSIERLCAIAGEGAGIYGPRILNVDRTIQPSASAVPGSAAWVVSSIWPSRLLPRRVREAIEPWRSERRRRVGWLTGVCLVGRTDELRRLGPFDPAIHMYSEDLELGLRAGEAGVPSVFAPDAARIVHIGDASSAKRYSDAGKRLSIVNRAAAVKQHRGRFAALVDRSAFVLGLALRFAAKTLLRRDATAEREWLRANFRRDEE